MIISFSNITTISTSDGASNDIVVAHDRNVTALDAESGTFPIIWTTVFESDICTISSYPDIDSNSIDEVLVGTMNSVHLLNGTDGDYITNVTNIGSQFRDVEPFNDYYNIDGVPEIITGNSDGLVMIIDVNPSSANFTKVVSALTFRTDWKIWTIKNINDVDSDGFEDFAIGSRSIGVLRGKNATWLWTDGVGNPSDYFEATDICLLDDRNNDGIDDIGMVAKASGGLRGGLYIYSSYGSNLEYVYDLSYVSGTVLPNCTETSGSTVEYTVYAYQEDNLTCTANVTIDGINYTMANQSDTWSTGVKFTYSTVLSDGLHNYSFTIRDSNGDQLNLTTRSGPLINGDCTPAGGDGNPPVDLETILISGGIIGGIGAVIGICAAVQKKKP